MAMKFDLLETAVKELVGKGVSAELFTKLRAAPSFESIDDAVKFIADLNRTYYPPQDWLREGVYLEPAFTHYAGIPKAQKNFPADSLRGILSSVRGLPAVVTVHDDKGLVGTHVINRLAIYVAVLPDVNNDAVAGYFIPTKTPRG